MRLVPTLWLGPRRLVRRPVESLILFLAVAFGTLGTVTAVDTTLGLLKSVDEGGRAPAVKRISVFANFNTPRRAVFPYREFESAIWHYQVFPLDSTWVGRVLPRIGVVETAYSRFTAWAKARTDEGRPWTDARTSFCADPGVFALSEVKLAAGRAYTAEEWRTGARVVVVGTALAAALWPGVAPDQVVGRTVLVNPIPMEERVEALTVVGVSTHRDGGTLGVEGNPSDWMALTKLPEIDRKYNRGQEFIFVARTAGEVPGLLGQLRALMDQDSSLRGQALDSAYLEYQRSMVVMGALGAVVLAVGAGTLLIALWTLGSVFRSRLPSLRRSLRLLRALGADRRALVFLGLSEILPVALGGLAAGTALALVLRHALDGARWLVPSDPWTLGGLVVFALGTQAWQVAPILAEAGTARSSGGAR